MSFSKSLGCLKVLSGWEQVVFLLFSGMEWNKRNGMDVGVEAEMSLRIDVDKNSPKS